MKQATVHIGTSGWHYKHWIGTFYPPATKPDQQFEFFQQYFDTVELNNSFYRLPSPENFTQWRKESPPHFLFVIKASRYITHQKKLKDPKETTHRFFHNIPYLKNKLGPVLFQLPPTWKINLQRLNEFLIMLPRSYRYVFEFRNSSWYTEEVFQLLRQHHCAFCIYELAHHNSPLTVTADFVYVRLHGPGDRYQGSYSRAELRKWATQCKQWQKQGLDVFVYFDNDQSGFAPKNALTLKALLNLQ